MTLGGQLFILTSRSYSGIASLISGLLPFSVLPAAFALILGWHTTNRRLIVASILAWLYPILAYGPLLLPHVASDHSAEEIVVATVNIEDIDEGALPSNDLIRLAESIETIEADVVLLQEISPPAYDWLRRNLAERLPYGAISSHMFPKAILSSMPLTDTSDVAASPWGPVAFSARVETGRHAVCFLSTHLQPAPFIDLINPIRWDELLRDGNYHKRKQIAELIGHIAHDEEAVIGGDFNLAPESAEYAMLSGRLQDLHRAAGLGLGLTWPSDPALPLLFRIDYLFATPGIHASSVRAQVVPGSDHCMVVARIHVL